MSTKQVSLAVPLLLLPLAASPAHAQDTETRALEGFKAIAVGGGIDLFVRLDDRFRVEVEAPDGELDDVITEVRDGTLEIRRRQSVGGLFDWGDHGSVDVTLPELVSLAASGGSDVRTEGAFSTDDLSIVASGGSDVTIEVAVTTLKVEASGGSDLRVTGSARSLRAHSSGGSDLNASQLAADEADVHSSGGSDLSIQVRDRVVGNASGGSDIVYSGEPRTVDVNSSGGSDVRRR